MLNTTILREKIKDTGLSRGWTMGLNEKQISYLKDKLLDHQVLILGGMLKNYWFKLIDIIGNEAIIACNTVPSRDLLTCKKSEVIVLGDENWKEIE